MRTLSSVLAIAVALASVPVSAASTQGGVSLGLDVAPAGSVPVADSSALYTMGGGGTLTGLLGITALPFLTPLVDVGYTYLPVQALVEQNVGVSLIRAGLGAVFSLPLGQRFSAWAGGSAGRFAGFLHAASPSSGYGFYARAEGGLSFAVSDRLGLEAAGGYDWYSPVYQGISFRLGTTVRLAGPGSGPMPNVTVPSLGSGTLKGLVRFGTAKIDPAFPVLFKYYDDHPLGTIQVTNAGSVTLRNIQVRLSMGTYVDNPKLSAQVDELPAGKSQTVPLYALFNEKVLALTEGTKVAAQVSGEYSANGTPGKDVETISVSFYDRNALRWDDDSKIAAFVTAKDDEILRVAKNTVSMTSGLQRQAVSANLQKAMALLAFMKAYGMSYIIDPASSYERLSQDPLAVDYVQFPRQTFQFRGGDCDDLSVTYVALLEAVGVPAGFITVPGHIYSAFRLEPEALDGMKGAGTAGDVITAADGTAWIPVETTLLGTGFLPAWSSGAQQWRDNAAAAKLIPTAAAWQTYAPVAFSIGTFVPVLPAQGQVASLFTTELDRLVAREIADRERRLLAALKLKPGDPATQNSLGVLYARYGRLDDADAQFRAATNGREFEPALVNLANLAYMKGSFAEARSLYARALAVDDRNSRVLIAAARVAVALGNQADGKAFYDRAVAIDPKLSSQEAVLGLSGGAISRASNAAADQAVVSWEE